MTDYPYSQQIHDKILHDWKNISFEEWEIVGNIISHPSVNYKLYWYGYTLHPNDISLWDSLSTEHAESLYEKLMKAQVKFKEDQEKERTAKQFLGLN